MKFVLYNNRIPLPKENEREGELHLNYLKLNLEQMTDLKSFVDSSDTSEITFITEWILKNKRLPRLYGEERIMENAIARLFRNREDVIRENIIKIKPDFNFIDAVESNLNLRKNKTLSVVRSFIIINNRLPFSYEKEYKTYLLLKTTRQDEYANLEREFPSAFINANNISTSRTKVAKVLAFLSENKRIPSASNDTTIRNYMFGFKRANGSEYEIIKKKLNELNLEFKNY